MDHKIKELEDICSLSRTSDTDSSDRESTATYDGSLKLTDYILQERIQLISLT